MDSKRRNKIKYSAGIVLIRKNYKTNQFEILMLKKRYTYAFYSIILEKNTRKDETKIRALLNKTTMEEKMILYQLNFEKAYNVIWNGTVLDKTFYENHRKQFYREWVKPDGGAKFLSLLRGAQHGRLEWSLPKGRKNSKCEKNLDCAIREFNEETNVSLSCCRILDCKRTYVIQDNGIVYHYTYFLAIPRSGIRPRINFSNRYQLDEIKDISWVPVTQINGTRLYGQVIKPMKSFLRKNASV
ncbi:NUDIX hydrolase [Candidatus Saccharibacteria bacterium]|nr:NUDIX hydrolase [Candidatus Saccharibacteria bacterium]